MTQFLRTKLLLGQQKLSKLQNSKVAIIGLGAVGSFALEALARAGVSNFLLVDSDKVQTSNINRQIFALHSTIEKYKTEVAKQRVLDINPNCKVETMNIFVNKENLCEVFKNKVDIVTDAIDSFSPKVRLIEYCYKNKIQIISSMGAALKDDISQITTADIFDTHHCKLAERLRGELKKVNVGRGIECVFSKQAPITKPVYPENLADTGEKFDGSSTKILGSLITITGTFGLTLAHLAIKKLTS